MARDSDLAGEAVTRLNQLRIGALVVGDGYGIVGMFTERDVLTRLVGARRDPWATRLRDVMTTPLVTVSRHEKLEHAMHVMTRRRMRHLPVVDGTRLLGLVSQGDLSAHVQRELRRDLVEMSCYLHGPLVRPSIRSS
jgi:CBS domain-containing protein